MPLASNPALDSIAHGMQSAFHAASMELRVVFDDARSISPRASLPEHLKAALGARIDAIIFYVVDTQAGWSEVEEARRAGIAVFSIARPAFPVNASLSYPGFNQGVFMMDYLTSLLAPASGVGIIGGPQALTDTEEVVGLTFAAQRSRCRLLNDPLLPEYSNLTDNIAGAQGPIERLLKNFPDLIGLAPYNDETMLGVIEYLDAIGRTGELRIVSRNGTPAAVRAVREGRTTGTWDLDPPGVGRRAAAMVIEHLQGSTLYEDYAAMSPAGRMITAANVDTWQPWQQRVQQTPLQIGL